VSRPAVRRWSATRDLMKISRIAADAGLRVLSGVCITIGPVVTAMEECGFLM